MNDFLTFRIRVIIVFYFTYLCTRALTKKAMAQMTAYELAGLMILANVAAEPLVDKVMVKSVYGAGLIVGLMFIISRLALRNKFTSILEHTPTIIIEKGKLDIDELNNLGLSLNQLEGLLRQQGYDKVSDLDTVIMEPQGNILYSNLKHIQRTKDWLLQELDKQGISDYKSGVGIAELDTNWKLNVLKK